MDVNDPTGYKARKAFRQKRAQILSGVKKIICAGCSGSGYYDDFKSPKCSSCDGTGKTLPWEVTSALMKLYTGK